MSENEYIRIMNIGRELTTKELILEFVKDLKAIEFHRVFGKDETLLDIILDKLEKWEKKL